ncbi:murein biosynthesis integral membrane protein MurJ [Rheinheimera sp.]|uniref:murein biosynthesis integral membrane protein MurJ n=1 Tax=Rheinheimera sp. TaxID=1869214 RepID=UPI0040478199
MRQILFSGLIVSFALFMGRISGFFREVFVANTFGISSHSDLIIVFLTIPDILVNLLVGGALGMVIIPELKRLNDTEGRLFYLQALGFSALVFFIIAGIFSFFSVQLLSVFAPGIDYSVAKDVSFFLKISLLAIPLTVVAGVTTAYLNHKGRFFIPAMGTLIFNIVVVVFLLVAVRSDEKYFFHYLSIGICVAAFVRWVSFLLNDRFSSGSISLFSHNLLSYRLGKRYLQCVLASGFLFLIPVVIRASASELGPGTLSLANYALKLVDFPLAVFLTVFSVVFLPKLSLLYSEGKHNSFANLFWTACVLLFFIATLITQSVIYFPEQITSLIYNWGGVANENIENIANLVSIAIYSLIFQSINSFLISAHAARNDTAIPFIVSIGGLLFFVIINGMLELSVVGMLYLMNISYLLISILLLLSIRVKHKILNPYFGFSRTLKMIFVLIISVCVLDYFSRFSLEIVFSVMVCFFVSVLSFVAWLIIDKDLRTLVRTNA